MMDRKAPLPWYAVMALGLASFCLLLPVAARDPLSARNANYTVNARLDPAQRILRGTVVVNWRNIQSIPTQELWFHLYYNAWKHPNTTWLRERTLTGPRLRGRPLSAIPEDEWAYIEIKSIRIRPGGKFTAPVDLSQRWHYAAPDDGNPDDQTVMVVELPEPVGPGEEVFVEIKFEERVPRTFARTGFRDDYFLFAHWFPKLGVYEADGTWNCHQFHAGTEFYSDYGVYDVRLTLPARYVVGATGILRERKTNKDGTVTYRFFQEDVHEFAWVASPRFIVVEDRFTNPKLPPVDIRLLLQPDHKGQAQRILQATKYALQYYGLWYGAYPYGHLTVVDPAYGSGTGGMEYPTLFTAGTRLFNPLGGGSPEGVTIHECGHQFWYGIVGNNEFEHAWLDEGFNTFSTGRVMDVAYGPRKYVRRYFRGFIPVLFRDVEYTRETYRIDSYRRAAKSDVQARPTYKYFPLTGSQITYSKTALWLYTLEKYLGWPTVQKILSTHFERYKFKHPKPDDFFRVANEVSGQDLSWFFDQVYRKAVAFDYEVSLVSTYPVPRKPGARNQDGDKEQKRMYRSVVVVRRNEEGHLPVTVKIVFEDGHVETREWDGAYPWTMYVFERPARLDYAVVDPDHKLMLDLYYSNNSRRVKPRSRFPSVKWASRWLFWLENLLSTLVYYA